MLVASLFFSACSQVAKPPPKTIGGGHVKTGKPYEIFGVTYYPLATSEGFVEEGIASWYGKKFHHRPTANGERYDMYAFSAAHKTLPLPTWVRVTNLENWRSIVLRVNDRGPFVGDRVIDLSYAAAKVLGFFRQGTVRVKVEALPSDEQKRLTEQARNNPALLKPGKTFSYSQKVSKPLSSQQIAKPGPKKILHKKTVIKKPKWPLGEMWSPGGMYIQAGSFQSFTNAKKMSERAGSLGRARIVSRKVNGATFFRVLVGPYSSPEKADGVVKKLVKMGVITPRLVLR